MTWLLLGSMFAVWLVVEGGGFDTTQLATAICNYGMIPGEITRRAPVGSWVPLGEGLRCYLDQGAATLLTPITSMFLHASWGHILGNAIFFWVFGNNIEDSMGPARFLAFYLVCGLVAATAQIMIDPASPIPTIGASGAISGVLGAYLVLYPRVKVNMLFWFIIIIRVIPIPAWIVLVYWFAIQVVTGLPQLSPLGSETANGGVAVWAHIGGFITGMLLIKFFENPRLVAARDAQWRGRPR
ncbi:MAG TPA: rhomboid family intramembrane serine protease [Gemmatimonadaceae bacterium]|nr:rhomboid family intramembrane serine protease [Gemmatimonadaceae bacterium]